ncbi:hypothetical protein GO755_04470 [Spirosoma sp. HMF4905]|uniref:Uncharacterized protein n=1 Tax=Spirosoma arboris TaxID=2682092 RepID=A0A7K1S6L4_9BACT|nr:hypothetical protein [Spirosoma arboris]MVM29276.1 hypothetical protein [Spirosoma arboris]
MDSQNNLSQRVDLSIRTLLELQLSQWQQLRSQLEADEEVSQVSIVYCTT